MLKIESELLERNYVCDGCNDEIEIITQKLMKTLNKDQESIKVLIDSIISSGKTLSEFLQEYTTTVKEEDIQIHTKKKGKKIKNWERKHYYEKTK